MASSSVIVQKMDNGGRRSGIDPRQFSYSGHIPERRGSKDRRIVFDRRSGTERRCPEERRVSRHTDEVHKSGIKIVEMRSYKERRKNNDRRDAFN